VRTIDEHGNTEMKKKEATRVVINTINKYANAKTIRKWIRRRRKRRHLSGVHPDSSVVDHAGEIRSAGKFT